MYTETVGSTQWLLSPSCQRYLLRQRVGWSGSAIFLLYPSETLANGLFVVVRRRQPTVMSTPDNEKHQNGVGHTITLALPRSFLDLFRTYH